jgi:hypothetical protein
MNMQEAEEIKNLKTELEAAQKRLREYELWNPLREEFVRAGGDPAEWELVRFDLNEQRRVDLDEFNEIVVLENGKERDLTPARFFREIYKSERPQLYKETAPAPQSGNRRTLRRAAFDKLPSDEKMSWVKSGGVVTD